jgi:hypothetical protein
LLLAHDSALALPLQFVRRMKTLLAVALAFMAGCTVGSSTGSSTGGSTGGTAPDASTASGGSNGDNGGSGSNTALACTGAAYDPCTDNTQCMSQNCKAFGGAGLEVCTITCTPGDDTGCLQNGVQGTCNNMGICKPPAANNCTR